MMSVALSRLPAEKTVATRKKSSPALPTANGFFSHRRPADRANAKKIDPSRVVAVQTVHTGATGRPGEVRVYCADSKDLTAYRFTPVRGDDPGAFSERVRRRLAVQSPEFRKLSLGAGNFLYLRGDRKPALMKS